MTKSCFLALSFCIVSILGAQAQMTNAFGQIGLFYNTNDYRFAQREHSIWVNSAVGLSLGRHFEVGVEMNQFIRYGREPYFDYLWDGGPFVRAKWSLREYHHFYAELGVLRGNICPCGGRGSEYIIKERGTYHLSFTNGSALKLKPRTYLFAEFYWNFILGRETADFGYINLNLGVRQYLRLNQDH